jgi:HD-GYP domain-containing protein (c-di-GMP phosphodiesterase class II)
MKSAPATQTPLLAATEDLLLGVAAHIDRMSRYAEVIARQLGLDADRARTIRGAAKLHDFGKIAIPQRILLKPRALTAQERLVIEQHAVIGHQLLRGSTCVLLDIAAVADVFDSLTRERSYRAALKPVPALELIRAGRGTQFDPDVVDAFFAAQAEIRRVRRSRPERS